MVTPCYGEGCTKDGTFEALQSKTNQPLKASMLAKPSRTIRLCMDHYQIYREENVSNIAATLRGRRAHFLTIDTDDGLDIMDDEYSAPGGQWGDDGGGKVFEWVEVNDCHSFHVIIILLLFYYSFVYHNSTPAPHSSHSS